jgi:hypothetical protein
MHACAAAGAGFLIAVLWFDLMFDVQTRNHAGDTLPHEILASISAYYRRVTTQAKPMSRLIGIVMLLTLLAIIVEIVRGTDRWWVAFPSLAAAATAIGLAATRTVPNAVRLGHATDTLAVQTTLARTIYRDHLCCLTAMLLLLVLQLTAQF